MSATLPQPPFDYRLPEELIAQQPAERREDARLMVVERHRARISHRRISDLPALLVTGDLVVANDSRVVPARLRGQRESGGRVELLVLANGSGLTDCLFRSSKGLRPGEMLRLPGNTLARVASAAQGRCRIELANDKLRHLLSEHGEVPLPPYIKREPTEMDRSRYQTVYAARPGAVAAPTAGLHLSHELIALMENGGIGFSTLTLAVGPGTFMPLRAGQGTVEAEDCSIGPVLAERANRVRSDGGRVVAIGTTSVRALESAADDNGHLCPYEGKTDLYIRPGYRFAVVDVLMTNFHLPGTTLLALVAAFAGSELAKRAYGEAVDERYRFYSYGDAMLIL